MRTYNISETYDIITYESAENGDTADNGFTIESDNMTAAEIASYLKSEGYIYWIDGAGTNWGWFSTEGCCDFRTGDVETKYFHINTEMPVRLLKAIKRSVNI